MTALADAIESVAGGYDPGVRRRPLQVFAEVLEDRRIFRRDGCEVVNRLVDAGGETGCRDVVAKDTAIDHLREESGLRNQFLDQVRDVLLAFGSEGFLIA